MAEVDNTLPGDLPPQQPDNTLPEQPAAPDNSLPTQPGAPDNTLPTPPHGATEQPPDEEEPSAGASGAATTGAWGGQTWPPPRVEAHPELPHPDDPEEAAPVEEESGEASG